MPSPRPDSRGIWRKDEDGRLEAVSPRKFRRIFGVEYVDRLIAPGRPSPSFLRRCRSFLRSRKTRMDPRRAASGHVAPVYIERIDARVGFGLFAFRRIQAGEVIGEYAGVLTKDWAADVAGAAEIDPYLLKYPFDSPYAIDAEKAGNETRFINHSSARANVRRAYLFAAGLLRVIFVASEAVPAGRQLLLDYGKSYWFGRTPRVLTCRGGAGATRPRRPR